MKVVIALGANLGDPRTQLASAITEIQNLLKVTAVSSFYETAPFGVPDSQPNYINAVLIGETEKKPLDLMNALLEIESALGRTRSFQNAARLIDIDIIDLDGLLLESESLTLPHPRAHERRFVLEPWLEIDPAAHLPGRGSVSELLAALT
ncbi:MAG: 2-amino-4-hydroxy-6-hydroxymethyldihydropteridine diphosphokinase [Actinobacteria bacterium]|nr:2-amino-4-hydroxy-6-hydroxymethyldihydropteridine diphosphokinase [Actinomycetota bacterium]